MLPRPSSHPLTTVILSQEVLRNIFAFKLFIYSFLKKKKKKRVLRKAIRTMKTPRSSSKLFIDFVEIRGALKFCVA